MAGGTGTRLWLLSRKSMPKQALNSSATARLFGMQSSGSCRSFGQSDHDRYAPSKRPQPPATRQVPCPPIGLKNSVRNRKPWAPRRPRPSPLCISRRKDPEAIMAVLTADHFISRVDHFREALGAAEHWAARASWSPWESGPPRRQPASVILNRAKSWSVAATSRLFGGTVH